MKCQLLKTASAQLFMMAAIATAIPKQEQSQKVDPRAVHSPQPCNPGPFEVTLGESELTRSLAYHITILLAFISIQNVGLI